MSNTVLVEKSVLGSLDEKVSSVKLPAIGTSRWVGRQKADVVAAIDGGLLSLTSALARYNLTLEELATWQRDYGNDGVKSMKRSALEKEVRAHRLESRQLRR